MTGGISLSALRPLLIMSVLVFAALITAGAQGAAAQSAGSAVYTLTNAAAGNQIAVFAMTDDGTLSPPTFVDTGGLGTGSGLGSQGAIVRDGDRLVAVNAGSDSISLFALKGETLELETVEPSGGDRPISVTINGNVVYVLNAGGSENITGFRIQNDDLELIPGSARPLSGTGVGPAQVEFSPNGRTLVVTEKGTNLIDVFQVGALGLTTGPVTHSSEGATPFGFAFADNHTLVVSEAFGGAADASATSSYDFTNAGSLTVVTPSLATTETAACWTVISKDGRYAYVTNTGSGSVTGYAIGKDGSLTILDEDGRTGETPSGSAPIDAAFDSSGDHLYVLSGGTNTVTAFLLGDDGSLTDLGSVGGLPASSVGLAAN